MTTQMHHSGCLERFLAALKLHLAPSKGTTAPDGKQTEKDFLKSFTLTCTYTLTF